MERKNIILPLLACTALIVAALCGCHIWKQLHVRQEEQREFEMLEEAVATQPPVDESDAAPSEAVVFHDVEMLVSRNPDCIGWLSIPGTAVSYPVMYTPDDPQKYLHRDFNGAYSESGTPFLDYRCNVNGDNLIIYGHNMINGTMFGGLKQLLDRAFLLSHRMIYLELTDGCHAFEIICVANVEKDDQWYLFRTSGDAILVFETVAALRARARINIGELPVEGERLLTLSTCTGVTQRQRLIVVAKQIL